MAEIVELEFRGSGSLFQQLEKLEGDVGRLGEVHRSAHDSIQQDLKESGAGTQRFSKDIAGASQLVVALAKSAGQGLPALAKNLENVADLTEQVQQSLSATDKANLTQVNAALREMAAKAGLVVAEVGKEKKARLDALVTTKKITQEEARLLGEVTAVVDALREVSEVPPPDLDQPIEKAQTLQQRYRQAFQEAQRLAGTPGPEFDKATAEAARLKEELADVRDRITALNPEDKIRAFSQLGSALAGGAQAAGGFFLVFSDGNQKLQESIFKFQSFLFALQGAQSFFADIKDSYSNVLAVLGLTNKVTLESAAASEIDAVAKGEQAVATSAVGTASSGAVTGIKGFLASILTSPVFAFAAGLAVVVGLIVAFAGSTDKARKSYAELLEEIQNTADLKGLQSELDNSKLLLEIEEDRLSNITAVRLGRKTQAEADKEDAENRRRAEKKLNDANRQGLFERQQLEKQSAALVQEAYGKLAAGAKSSSKERADALKFLGLEEKATAEEIEKAYDEAYSNRVRSARQAGIDILAIDARSQAAATERVQKAIEEEKTAADLRKRIKEDLASALAEIEKNLQEKIAALEIEEADPIKALELRRAAANKEVDLLERDMRRAVALIELRKTMSAELLDQMTEKEREAAADRRIAEGGGELNTTQIEQLAAFRVLTQQKYLRESIELNRDNARTLLELEAEGAETRRKGLALDLEARAVELRKAGATEAQITADAALKRRNLEREIASDALSLEEKTQLDLIAARTAGSKGNAAAERAAQIEVLTVKLEFAEKALLLIEDTGTAEARAQVASARKVIAELKAELDSVTSQVVPISIFDLLGLNISAKNQEVLKAAFADIGQAINDIVRANMAARALDLQSQITNTDAIVDDQRRRRSELEAELSREEEKSKEGLANNVLNVRKAIAETKRIEIAALAEKKRIQQEQQKLARQQVVIDSLSQASSLATGVANLIKTWSTLPFGIGLISAFAQGALIYSFFSGIKTKLAATSGPQAFWKGTKSVQRAAGESSGVDTIAAMLTEDEAVVPVRQNQKHRGIVGAVIDDDFSQLTDKELEPILNQIDLKALLDGTGVSVNEKETREVITLHTKVQDRERVQSLSGVESRLDTLNQQVQKMREANKQKTSTERLPDGTVIRRGPFGTEVLLP